MEHLKEAIEVQKVSGVVVNGVDNPNIMSLDSTTPIVTGADELPKEEDSGTPPVEVKKNEEASASTKDKPAEEKKEEEVKEEKKEEETKPEGADAVQKRMNTLTKKWRTAERERDWERTKRQELEEENAKLKASTPATDKPVRADFVDDDDYLEALTDWKVEQKLKSKSEVTVKTTEEEEDKKAAAELYEHIDSVIETGREKYKDFNEVALAKDVIITPDMTEVILDSPAASDIMYYLGKNPDIAESISKMSPLKAAKELAKIEEEFIEPPQKEEVKETLPKKDKTNAPPPIRPVKTTGVVDRDPTQMSAKEYRAWRESNKE
jgi:hypothetical protein